MQNHLAGPRGGTIPPYEAWRRSHFSAAELSDPMISGDDADPDGDGLTNIVEGGNLLNPRVADSPFTPILNFDPGGFMKAEFDRPFFTSDLDQGIEISSDLGVWVKDGILLSPPVDNGDGTWRFMIRDRETSATSPRRFMRHVIRKSK